MIHPFRPETGLGLQALTLPSQVGGRSDAERRLKILNLDLVCLSSVFETGGPANHT